MNRIDVKCACGTLIGSHTCQLSWQEPEPSKPTYSKMEVLLALEWAMDVVPSYVWDRIEEGLDKVK